jgi:hypothetical protein
MKTKILAGWAERQSRRTEINKTHNMATIWKTIESMPEATAALSWRRWLGPMFNRVTGVCLRRTGNSVERIPCEKGCACNHRVLKMGTALVGVCDCGKKCPDMPLTDADVQVWEVDVFRLAWWVTYPLRCDVLVTGFSGVEVATPFGLHRTVQVTAFDNPAVPVLLTCQADASGYRAAVAHLAARLKGFVLLTPTKLTDASTLQLLDEANARCFDLESNLELLPNGELQVSKKGQELFVRLLAECSNPDGRKVAARSSYSFRQAGSMCDIVYDWSELFHLKNTDGAKYLDYLLHHPNKVVRAIDLEKVVKPDKAKYRDENSIHKAVDAQTKREARQDLVSLKAELEEAEVEGQTEKVQRLKDEIAKVQAVVGNESLLGGDTGERARDHVRHALKKDATNLRKGNKDEQAFGIHVGRFVSLGYEIIYNQPESVSWD